MLAKPLSYPELLARLHARLRRAGGQAAGAALCVGALRVDPRSRQATVEGRPVDLSTKEFALLVALARDPERVVAKRELLRDVWGYAGAARTRTVDSHASRLRRKLLEAGAPERYVTNVWGVGYRLLPRDALSPGLSCRRSTPRWPAWSTTSGRRSRRSADSASR